jgi:formylglycine-generating enzyme required for sulfatase activity
LAGYFDSAELTAGGMIAEILGSLTLTATKKVGSKGIKDLIAQVPDEVSIEDAERVLSSVEVTSSAQTQWDAHVASIEAEIEVERQRVETEKRAEFDRLFEGNRREFGSGNCRHEMMFIPKGEFLMGALEDDSDAYDDEKPRHKVILTRDFLMGKYPVTEALWESVMGSNPSHFKGVNKPVEKVSWFDVVEFCNKLSKREGLEPAYTINGENVTCNWSAKGYRLPTEAEWEYSARSGQRFKYAGSNNVDEVAWYTNNSGKETHPVGLKKPNGFGLYDMSGNVFEWCWDRFGDYSSGTQTDPTGPDRGPIRVIRGGCWRYYARSARVSNRFGFDPSSRSYDLGFRLLRFVQ